MANISLDRVRYIFMFTIRVPEIGTELHNKRISGIWHGEYKSKVFLTWNTYIQGQGVENH